MSNKRATLGKINAISVYVVWALFILLTFLSLLGLSGFKFIDYGVLGYVLKFLIGLVVLHVVFAYFIRCPYCNKCLTIQGFAPTHENSERQFIFNGWAVVVMRWFTGKIVCIYCGEQVNTNVL